MTPTLLLTLSLAIGAPAPKETPKTPPAKLEGVWEMETVEGPKGPPPGTVTFTFTKDTIAVVEGKRAKPETASYSVDFTKKPAHIDIQPPAQAKAETVRGIYEINGDTLKLAFGRDGGERPTEFKGDADRGIVFITFKRVKRE